eukprot:Nitzschia sp. Nitz4//scaffold54_size114964//86650//88089//NITZ4_003862-RA/size114964-processed-gene-0.167-mRNA-1//1//CDS//3329554384//9458//frame0
MVEGPLPRQPAVIVAGTHSGCGKTTVTMAIIAALKLRGKSVQPYKCGPDFIDPEFHTAAAGRPCRNLDTRMLSEDGVRDLYFHTGKDVDICVIEGVMGLFDGAGPEDERGSAADLARLLDIPVILVIDARAMARSAAAMALGYAKMDPRVRVAGIVLNRLGSPGHADLCQTAVEKVTGIPVVANIVRDQRWEIPERHLGLAPREEGTNGTGIVAPGLSDLAQYMIDNARMDLLEELAATAGPTKEVPSTAWDPTPSLSDGSSPVIAVARDEAFWFYYPENIELLESRGAQIAWFSPLRDKALPKGTDAIYIGGGYPELHGARLESNVEMLDAMRQAINSGMPVYAECGGFMYLNESIVDAEEVQSKMVGVFPGTMKMGKRLFALGYADARTREDSILGPQGTELRGHVFHWASLELASEVGSSISAGFGVEFRGEEREEGMHFKNCIGSWLHLHFLSNPRVSDHLVQSARKFMEEGKLC